MKTYIIVAALVTLIIISYVVLIPMGGSSTIGDWKSNIIHFGENEKVVKNVEGEVQAQENNDSKPQIVVESEESVARRETLKRDLDNGLFILVNKQNPLDSSYKPDDLKDIKYFASNRTSVGRFMRAEAADAFHQLSEAAAMEGHEIVVTTAYRSYDFQSNLYNSYVKNHGQQEADTFSAQPGKSEHQTGLAADVSSPSVDYELTQDYIDTPEGTWLKENACEFGFIIRYPKGKEDITGYMYEPWHIRYVGKTAAKEIFNKGMTLEEYLEKEI